MRDTGPGRPAERAEELFAPFVSYRPHGMGIGLALVRAVAAAHGGRAWIDGGTGGGVVHVELPAAAGIGPCVSV